LNDPDAITYAQHLRELVQRNDGGKAVRKEERIAYMKKAAIPFAVGGIAGSALIYSLFGGPSTPPAPTPTHVVPEYQNRLHITYVTEDGNDFVIHASEREDVRNPDTGMGLSSSLTGRMVKEAIDADPDTELSKVLEQARKVHDIETTGSYRIPKSALSGTITVPEVGQTLKLKDEDAYRKALKLAKGPNPQSVTLKQNDFELAEDEDPAYANQR